MMKQSRLILILCLTVALVVMPAAAVKNVIAAGGDVFIGEQGLNVTAGVNTTGSVKVAWFQPNSSTFPEVPDAILTINPTNFYVAPSDFVGKNGNWYVYPITGDTAVAFTVNDPSFELRVWDLDANKDVTGKSVTLGERLDIRLETNFYVIASRPGFNSTTDGYVLIKVRTADGVVYSALNANTTFARSLQNVVVNTLPFYWAHQDKTIAWNTSAVDTSGELLYPQGVYTLTAECNVNFMRDNYVAADGSFFIGKTVTAPRTVTIASDTVRIEANKDAVVRGNPFSVTITGRPNQAYFIWVKGTSSMSGDPALRDQPPFLTANQDSLKQDNPSNIVFGNYVFEGGDGRTIQMDVPTAGLVNGAPNFNGTLYYGLATLSNSGTRTLGFATTHNTRDKMYTIRVEQNFGTTSSPNVKSDEVDVKVEEGAVTIVAAGDQSYFLGEEVKLAGTNSETNKVYLFITGPELPSVGGNLANPGTPVVDGQAASFTSTDIMGDNTWEYKWQTKHLNINPGSFVIYAVETPNDKDHLGNTEYGNVSVLINEPFLSATLSKTEVAKGENLFINGVAEGNPTPGVLIWIFGPDETLISSEGVNSDASFSHEVSMATTQSLTSGQYFVIVQHPMQNDTFDVFPGTGADEEYVDGSFPITPSRLFKIGGEDALHGSDAADALIQAINNPVVDDTYVERQFLIKNDTLPTWFINASAGTGGTINPNGILPVRDGEQPTFEMTSNPGYVLADVFVNDVPVGASPILTLAPVHGNQTIRAWFYIPPNFVYVASFAGLGGSITPEGDKRVKEGSNLTYIITPDAGYEILDVTVDMVSKGPVSTYNFINVSVNHMLYASFWKIGEPFTIYASVSGNGSISPSGSVTVNKGANQSFTIIPDAGFQVDNVYVDWMPVGAVTSYTFTNVKKFHTITGKFKPVTPTSGFVNFNFTFGDFPGLKFVDFSGLNFFEIQ